MLGAYEPLGESWAVGATLVSLYVLFRFQWRGTSEVGGFFGWFMMLIWFPWIALKGLPWIARNPEVFLSLNPAFAFTYLTSFPHVGAFVILGVVVLAITGGEAKYADIGHFARKGEKEVAEGESLDPKDSGRRPVMTSWFALVLPCLLCNYFGQVGYLLERGLPPRGNTFYALTPRTGSQSVDGADLAMDMVLSGIAAFIASQALITGMFSIVKQAISLGFCPRFEVRFTSREAEGQVYIPAINWSMFFGCAAITLIFRTSGNLAAAYGIAVTGTMGITTLAFGYVSALSLGLGPGEGFRGLLADSVGRLALLQQQPSQVHARRLLPDGDRLGSRRHHAHLAMGPIRDGQGVLLVWRRGESPLAGWSRSGRRSTRSASRSSTTSHSPGPSCKDGDALSRPIERSSFCVHARFATWTNSCRSP